MTKPTITIHDTQTNEIVEREMTADELAWYKSVNAPYQPTEEEAKAAADKATAEAKLAKLGLTTDDLKALGL
jgi:hypothetical protein